MKLSARVSAVLRRLGLLATGLMVLALPLGTVAVASLQDPVQPGAVETDPLSVSVGATTWVCAPAPTLLTAGAGEDLDYDPELGTGNAQVSTLVELTAIGATERPAMTAGPLGEESTEATGAGALTTISQSGVTAPLVARVEPTQDGVPLVGGVSVARADVGDLRGLVASTCQQPVSSAYLVAGSTELGSSAKLVLTNPGDTAATVSLTAWGATGPLLDSPAEVVVPAGGVQDVLLETISLEPRIAVHIDAEGGRVVPTIQASSLNGLIAAGTDIVGPAADPTTELLVAGVPLSTAPGASATLRLLNPADEAATVSVEMLGPDGASPLGGATDSVVEPGTVADISLAGLPNSNYGLRVTSDLPVTGAVQMVRTGVAGEDDPDTPPVDVAWLPASALADRGVIPIPAQLVDTTAVTVTNPGLAATEVTVTGYDAHGLAISEATTTVAAGSTTPVEVPGGAAALVVDGSQIVASAVVASAAADGTIFSAYPIVADPHAEQAVVVRVTG